MNIKINGDFKNIPESISMIDLIENLGLKNKQAIAIAVNGEILIKSQYSTYILAEGDSIEIVQAIGGGSY